MSDSDFWPIRFISAASQSNQAHEIPEDHRQEWQTESFKWPNVHGVAPRTRICLNYEDSSPNERMSTGKPPAAWIPRVHLECSRLLIEVTSKPWCNTPPVMWCVASWVSVTGNGFSLSASCCVSPAETNDTAQRPFWSKLCCQNLNENFNQNLSVLLFYFFLERNTKLCLHLLNNFSYSWLFFRLYAAFFDSR